MRGYVENLEREHFNHEDGCNCEIEQAGRTSIRPSFEEFMAAMETSLPHGGECDCEGCGEWYIQHKDD